MKGNTERRKANTRMLCEGAIFVALAQVLGYLVLYRVPNGGSICLSMLPIILFACRWGVKSGVLAGLCFGILQYIGDNGISISWLSMVVDYLVAFGLLGTAGFFRGKKWSIFAGTAVASLARFAAHFIVGALVWGQYMPEEFLGMAMTDIWVYSLIYNGVYMLPNAVLCLLAFALLSGPLGKYFTGADLKLPNA